MNERIQKALRCQYCREKEGAFGSCAACGAFHPVGSELYCYLSTASRKIAQRDLEGDRENAFKNYFKRWPRLYDWMVRLVAPALFTGLTAKGFVRGLKDDIFVLNIGSGPTRLRPDIVNVDLFPFPNVDVLAQAEKLPFVDHAFDAIVCDQVLEHVSHPSAVTRELVRVLKPGGTVYIGTPFMYPLHPSPSDYGRWSVQGLEMLFEGCERVTSGVSIGPTSGMLSVLAVWLGTVFSFGIPSLRKVLKYPFMIVLSPFKLLDHIFGRLPGAEDAAAAVYVVMRKPNV